MSLKDLGNKLAAVSDIYADRFAIDRSGDWYLLKLQEEVGELCAAWLKVTNRARTTQDAQENLQQEMADVLAHALLFAHSQKIDVDAALQEKWLHYLPSEKT